MFRLNCVSIQRRCNHSDKSKWKFFSVWLYVKVQSAVQYQFLIIGEAIRHIDDDLLNKYDAPDVIDYLSIDTEGSELDILTAYDFSRIFKVITVEHNYTDNREKIHDLLSSKGYVRIMENLSKWDDWYVHKLAVLFD